MTKLIKLWRSEVSRIHRSVLEVMFVNAPPFLPIPLVDAMGKRSREIAEEKYDVHKVNAQMLGAMG